MRLGSCTAVYGLPSPNSLFKEINNQSPCGYGFKERVVLRRSTACPGLAQMFDLVGLLPNQIQDREDITLTYVGG